MDNIALFITNNSPILPIFLIIENFRFENCKDVYENVFVKNYPKKALNLVFAQNVR